jgi:hypothetical protein
LTGRGKHRVDAALDWSTFADFRNFLPTRQFLPGGLLINGLEILVVVGGRDDNQRHKIEHKINQGKPPCVTMISAAAMTSKTVATTAAAA